MNKQQVLQKHHHHYTVSPRQETPANRETTTDLPNLKGENVTQYSLIIKFSTACGIYPPSHPPLPRFFDPQSFALMIEEAQSQSEALTVNAFSQSEALTIEVELDRSFALLRLIVMAFDTEYTR